MKAESVWSLAFAAIAAATGVIYLVRSRNEQQGTVVNNFPPLSTGNPAPEAVYGSTYNPPVMSVPSLYDSTTQVPGNNTFAPYNTVDPALALYDAQHPTNVNDQGVRDANAPRKPKLQPWPVYSV